jgi:hypothetical protein
LGFLDEVCLELTREARLHRALRATRRILPCQALLVAIRVDFQQGLVVHQQEAAVPLPAMEQQPLALLEVSQVPPLWFPHTWEERGTRPL